jgi:hypothetical protein
MWSRGDRWCASDKSLREHTDMCSSDSALPYQYLFFSVTYGYVWGWWCLGASQGGDNPPPPPPNLWFKASWIQCTCFHILSVFLTCDKIKTYKTPWFRGLVKLCVIFGITSSAGFYPVRTSLQKWIPVCVTDLLLLSASLFCSSCCRYRVCPKPDTGCLVTSWLEGEIFFRVIIRGANHMVCQNDCMNK